MTAEYTREDVDRLTAWAAEKYPSMWREDPDEVRSAVGWALATSKRIEWVLNDLYRKKHPETRSLPGPRTGRRCYVYHPRRPPDVPWDGRVHDDFTAEHSIVDRRLVEWADPTGDEAASRADALTALDTVHPDYRQALLAYAQGGTPVEIATAIGRTVSWVNDVVYRGRGRANLHSPPKTRRDVLIADVAAGHSTGRSIRQIAHDKIIASTTLAAVWRAHLEEAAA